MNTAKCRTDTVLLLLLLAAVFLLAFNKIHDTDAWMHLSLGRLIWDGKGLPATELFVYPNFSEPFSYTSWLFAVLFYLAFLAKGAGGLVFLKALTVSTAFFFLWRDAMQPKRYAPLALLVLTLVALIAMHRFVMRPDIFLMLFLASTIAILNAFLYDNNQKGLYFLPVILLAWANIHTSVNLIVVPLGAFVIGSLMQGYLNRRGLSEAPFLSTRQIKVLLLCFAGALLLSLLNPNGIGQYLAGVRFIGADFYKQEIEELLPPKGNIRIALWAVIALLGLSFVLNRKQFSIIHLLLVLPFMLMPFMATRFVYLIVIVGGPILCRNVAGFCTARKPCHDFAQGRLSIAASVLAVLTLTALYLGNRVQQASFLVGCSNQFGAGFDESAMPSGAVAFMNREKIFGRVFNAYSDGQYLIWTGYPQRQVFMDARGGLPKDLLEKSFRFRTSNQIVDELFARYQFDSILLPAMAVSSNDADLRKIDSAFQHPDWALVYWDNRSLLYVKRQGPYQPIIDRFEYRHVNPDAQLTYFASTLGDAAKRKAIEDELLRNITETGSSKARLYLGALYYSSRQYDRAIDILEQAIAAKEANEYTRNAHALLGDIFFTTGDLAKSLAYYRQAPGNREAPVLQYNIGRILYRQGDLKGAIAHLERAVKLDPKSIDGYSSLIEAYQASGQTKKAAALQPRYSKLAGSQSAKLYFERGIAAQQNNDLDAAIAEYQKSLAANPAAPVVCTNLGFVYLDKGQPDMAYDYFLRAVQLQNDFANAHYGLALIYKERRQADKAIEHFERYCALEPRGFFYRTAREQVSELRGTGKN